MKRKDGAGMRGLRESILIGILLFCVCSAEGAGGRLAAGVLEETLEFAARRSGRVLSGAAKVDLERTLLKMSTKYGDDILVLVRRGGLEVLEQGARHGDRFWRLCREVPEASRSLALHADELLPLAERIGPEVLRLEAKMPGTAVRAVGEFGDDGIRLLSAQSPENITRLLGYAAKADSPATRKLLLETCAKSKDPSKFLNALNWKNIMAGGLSTAAILAAARISDGLREGVKDPAVAADVISSLSAPVRYGLFALIIILLMPLLVRCISRSIAVWKKSRRNDECRIPSSEHSESGKDPSEEEERK